MTGYSIIAQNGRSIQGMCRPRIIFTDDSRELAHRIFLAYKNRFKRLGFKEQVNTWLYKNAITTATLAKDGEAIRFVLMATEDAEMTVNNYKHHETM